MSDVTWTPLAASRETVVSYEIADAPVMEFWGGRRGLPFRVEVRWDDGKIRTSATVYGYKLRTNGEPGKATVNMTVFGANQPDWLRELLASAVEPLD